MPSHHVERLYKPLLAPGLGSCFHHQHQHHNPARQTTSFKNFTHQLLTSQPQQLTPTQQPQLPSSNSNLRNGCHHLLHHLRSGQLRPLGLQQVSDPNIPSPNSMDTDTEIPGTTRTMRRRTSSSTMAAPATTSEYNIRGIRANKQELTPKKGMTRMTRRTSSRTKRSMTLL